VPKAGGAPYKFTNSAVPFRCRVRISKLLPPAEAKKEASNKQNV